MADAPDAVIGKYCKKVYGGKRYSASCQAIIWLCSSLSVFNVYFNMIKKRQHSILTE